MAHCDLISLNWHMIKGSKGGCKRFDQLAVGEQVRNEEQNIHALQLSLCGVKTLSKSVTHLKIA